MAKGVKIALLALVFLVTGFGFFYQLLTKPIDVNFTILFVLNLLILYVLLKDVRLK